MLGISGAHLLVIGIIMLLFGPKRLPELGHKVGKAMRNFQDGLSGVTEARFRRIEEEHARAQTTAGAAGVAAATAPGAASAGGSGTTPGSTGETGTTS